MTIVERDEVITLSDASGLSVVGRSAPPVERLEKVSGAARYIADISLPAMLEAKVLRHA